MRSFYHFTMKYRGIKDKNDPKKRLAEWMFSEHDFPKQSNDHKLLTDYLEFNSPFPEALVTFDEIWEDYLNQED